jgi:hypothetical protein
VERSVNHSCKWLVLRAARPWRRQPKLGGSGCHTRNPAIAERHGFGRAIAQRQHPRQHACAQGFDVMDEN